MSIISRFAGDSREHFGTRARRLTGLDVPTGPFVVLVALALVAVGYIVYVLWPRWPGLAASDAPEIPVTIGTAAFELPTAAIRVPVQRRPGAHDRVDLVLLWPSLKPPDPAAKPAPPGPDLAPTASNMLDRIFVTLALAGDALSADERLRNVYPRYASETPVAGPSGLAVLPFRDGTPYQGEDLIYDASAPDNFLVRCTRAGAGPTPGICLYERRIDTADITVRFPRDIIGDWEMIAASLDRLITSLRPGSQTTTVVPAKAGTQ
jgi:hypothetical protein